MVAFARKPNRKPDHDYTDFGRYFITINTAFYRHILWANSELEFGERNDPPELSRIGCIVQNAIMSLPEKYQNVDVDIFSIMPDHIHLIISLRPTEEFPEKSEKSIPTIVHQLKRRCSKIAGFSLWHTSYYDRVIRSDEEYGRIWVYIDNNPYCLDKDER